MMYELSAINAAHRLGQFHVASFKHYGMETLRVQSTQALKDRKFLLGSARSAKWESRRIDRILAERIWLDAWYQAEFNAYKMLAAAKANKPFHILHDEAEWERADRANDAERGY